MDYRDRIILPSLLELFSCSPRSHLIFGMKPCLPMLIWLKNYHLLPYIMNFLTFVCIKMHQIILILILVDVFVLFIFRHIEGINLPHNLSSVFFLAYGGTQKGFLCYDSNARQIRASRIVIFFKNQPFLAHKWHHSHL